MSSDDLSRFCGQNRSCELHGVRDGGNLSVHELVGKHRNIRLLRCNACQTRFSEPKGTPFYRSKLPHEKTLSILEHWDEGIGTRQISRLCHVHRDTVTRLAVLVGKHSHANHDELVVLSPLTREVQLDEKWAFVGKKQAQCDPANPDDAQCGDHWDHVAYDPEHRLVLAVVPGSRTIENTEAIVEEMARRLDPKEDLLITTDELAA